LKYKSKIEQPPKSFVLISDLTINSYMNYE